MLHALMQQGAALEAEISRLQQAERQNALRQIKELISMYNIDIAKELGSSAGSARKATSSTGATRNPVPVKYRDPESGDTWTGRGLQPRWLRDKLAAGAQLTDFSVT